MIVAARLVIWSFFILIPTKFLEFFALVHNSPVRPHQAYAVLICAGAAVLVTDIKARGLPILPKGDLVFSAISLSLALLILASPGGHQEYFLKMALWPLANTAMGYCLFYFVTVMGLNETVRSAAIGALVVQLGGILIDLWFPGTFAEWAPRPAGLPQNSNNGALLICMLLTFLLPVKLGQSPGRPALYAAVASAPLLFATLSKAGLLYFLAVVAILLGSAFCSREKERLGRTDAIIAAFLLVFMTGALVASPNMQRADTTAIWHSRIGIAPTDIISMAYATGKSEQADIDKSMRESDDTNLQRWKALTFFLGEAIKRPLFGFGTGYSYSFTRGPHNSIALLFVENGILAPLLYAAGLMLLGLLAFRRKAVSLMALVAVGAMNAMLSHTQIVEPWFAVFAFAALGAADHLSAVSDDTKK